MDATTTNHHQIPHQRLAMEQQFRPEALTHIRHIVDIHLTLWKMQEVADRCLVILSELCSNISHTGDMRFGLTVIADDSTVHMSVRDYSTSLPVIPQQSPPLDTLNGRGLHIVATYADKIGMDLLPDGKVIWAELTLLAAGN